LTLNKTLATLDEVEQSSSAKSAPPNPELYIIVNRKPTKPKVVWRSLVDVNQVKAAIQKLKSTNWLYRDVTDESVNEAAKQVVEVTNNTTSTILEKASENEIARFQSFTIRNLDNKLPGESDIEQYKVLGVKEDPLDNRQWHLVVCVSQFSFQLENLVSITHELNSPTVSTSSPDCSIKTRVSEKIPNMSSTYSGRRACESFSQLCITC